MLISECLPAAADDDDDGVVEVEEDAEVQALVKPKVKKPRKKVAPEPIPGKQFYYY